MKQSKLIFSLNKESLQESIDYLSALDPDLAQIVNEYGNPPMWQREPGFSTLLHIILEQQVSLASAKAAFTKLERAAGDLTPERFLQFSDHELRLFGFSRQKTRYGRELASAVIDKELDLEKLFHKSDEAVRQALMKIKGIGNWTANIYLLMALLRPDIWPSGDLALAKAVQDVYNLSKRPGQEKIAKIAEKWSPWRAVAARILWHYYLSA
jgi:DNA-3-methyladenine glycosylase II